MEKVDHHYQQSNLVCWEGLVVGQGQGLLAMVLVVSSIPGGKNTSRRISHIHNSQFYVFK